MKQILSISCNDEEFNISVDGDNYDLLIGIAQVLKEIAKESDYTAGQLMKFIKSYMEDQADD